MIFCFEIVAGEKFLGIYLDHEVAHIIEYRDGRTVYETLRSGYRLSTKKTTAPSPSDISEGRRKLELLLNYYRSLIARMKNYSRVVLFGPGEAKNELHKLALSDTYMQRIDVCVSKMTSLSDQQIDEFVREYFDERPVHFR